VNSFVGGSRLEVFGGGIFCVGESSPAIVNCIITNNRAGNGAGIICYAHSSPKIRSCTIIGNKADWGGGISMDFGVSAVVEDCIISKNEARDGSSIYIGKMCSPKISRGTFEDNSTDIYIHESSDPIIADCTYE